jgi:hypothetical protein
MEATAWTQNGSYPAPNGPSAAALIVMPKHTGSFSFELAHNATSIWAANHHLLALLACILENVRAAGKSVALLGAIELPHLQLFVHNS